MAPELSNVRAAIASRQFDQAEQLARSMPPSIDQARAFMEIAERSDRPGLLDEAAQAIPADTPPWSQADFLNRIAKLLLRAGRKGPAQALWNRAILAAKRGMADTDADARTKACNALSDIVIGLAGIGDPRALDLAESIVDPVIRARTTGAIS